MKNKEKIGTHFETYLSYAKENYVSRVNANDLLSLEMIEAFKNKK